MVELAQLITALATLIVAIAGFLVALRRLEDVHKLTNSLKDELVAEVKKASFAAGQKQEREREGRE